MNETEKINRIDHLQMIIKRNVENEKYVTRKYSVSLKNVIHERLVKIENENSWNYLFLLRQVANTQQKIPTWFEPKDEEKQEVDFLFKHEPNHDGRNYCLFDLEGIVEVGEKIILKAKRITFKDDLIEPCSYESRNTAVVIPKSE